MSIHLDDVVLSCGNFLAANPGMVVITTLAGAPDEDRDGYNAVTTGEKYAPDQIKKRRNEDADALDKLGVTYEWLNLYDSCYMQTGANESQDRIVSALAPTLKKHNAKSVVIPLGLGHSDHISVGNACKVLAASDDLDVKWYVYEDMPSALRFRTPADAEQKGLGQLHGDRATRLAALRDEFQLTELAPFSATNGIKHETFKLYASQYMPLKSDTGQAFIDMMSLDAQERYWLMLPKL